MIRERTWLGQKMGVRVTNPLQKVMKEIGKPLRTALIWPRRRQRTSTSACGGGPLLRSRMNRSADRSSNFREKTVSIGRFLRTLLAGCLCPGFFSREGVGRAARFSISNFRRSFLPSIEAYLADQIRVGKLSTRSTVSTFFLQPIFSRICRCLRRFV